MASTNPRNGLCSDGQGATVVEGADHGHSEFYSSLRIVGCAANV